MLEQHWEHSETSFNGHIAKAGQQSGLICFHGAESHSGWFVNLSTQALNSGAWQHVSARDRPGWRGDVLSPEHVYQWIESSIDAALLKMQMAGESCAIDLVASSWGALALLSWWCEAKPTKLQPIRSVHLVAPGVFISKAVKQRIRLGLIRDTLRGGGLFSGKISLELGLQDFIKAPEKYIEATKFIECDELANHHVSPGFIRTTNHLRRNVLRAFSGDALKMAGANRPPLMIHLSASDDVIDLPRTREFAIRGGIRLHQYDVRGHGLVLMQPSELIAAIKQHSPRKYLCKDFSIDGFSQKQLAVEVFEKKNPFWLSIRHSHGSRNSNQSYILKITAEGFDQDLISGFGEALPRSYLTGENMETFRNQIQPVFESIARPIFKVIEESSGDVERTAQALVKGWHEASAVGCLALWTGIDLAIVDWWSKATGVSVVRLMQQVCVLLNRDHRRSDMSQLEKKVVDYRDRLSLRATVPMVSVWLAMLLTRVFVWVGYRSLKFKVGDGNSIPRLLSVARICRSELSRNAIDITLDGNQGFTFEQAIEFSNRLKSCAPQLWQRITAFEDPIEVSNAKRLSEFSSRASVSIMADEMLYNATSLQDFMLLPGVNYWNLRIGKCGGLTGAVIMAWSGFSHGINLVVGALVGEDKLMQRAGDIVCEIFPVVWRDESFSKFLLRNSSFADSTAQSDAAGGGLAGFGVDLAEDSFRSSIKRFKFFMYP